MVNLVDEIDALKQRIDLEGELRNATDLELRNGEEEGPMQHAHDTSIENVIACARALVEKADATRG